MPPPATQAVSPDASPFDDVFDERAAELGRVAAEAGFTEFVVGVGAGDADDTPIEVQWPARRIGIVAAGVTVPTIAGWDLRASDDWTPESLLAALEGSSA